MTFFKLNKMSYSKHVPMIYFQKYTYLLTLDIVSFIHSFIPDVYIVPLQETYSEALTVQLRPKRNVLRSL